MGYGLLIAGWTVYFALHSLLASSRVKQLAERLLGRGFRFYRLVYSFISITGLVALIVVNESIEGPNYFLSEGPVRFAGAIFTTVGVILIQVSLSKYGLTGFLGFKQEEAHFQRDGILDWIRHPIYSGLILMTIGFFLFVPKAPTAITCGCILCYIPIGMYLEERKLIRLFGDAYLNYKREVPALIPRWSRMFKG